MICIAVCDDDTGTGNSINDVVEECCKQVNTACRKKVYNNSKALLYDVMEGVCYDILLLDIEMPELDGMTLTSKIKEFLPDALVLFLTSYEKYVYQTFEVQPYRFIPKKYMAKMLPAAVSDALRLAAASDGKFLIAENQKTLEKIPLKSITHIWHKEKYAYIEKTHGETTKARKTLKQIYQELPAEEFAWTDRGCIVSLMQIERVTGETIILTTGISLNVSRDRMTELKTRIRKYWIGKEGIG